MTDLIHLSDVQRREVVWLEHGTIPRGMLSILAGHPGLGKSLWALKLAAELSRRGQNTVVCSAEDSLEYSIKPRLQALDADTSLIHALVPFDQAGNPRGVSFPTDAVMLLEAIREVGAVYAIVDPISAQLDAAVDSHKDASLRSALAPLARIAEETTAAVQAVWHLNKSTGTDPMMRLGGSIGGPGAARSALLLDRDPDDSDPDRGTRRVLAHFKCNVGKLQPSRLLNVEEVLLPADSLEPEVTTARIVDVGSSPHSAETLLAAGGDEDGAGNEAAEFLLAELAGGGEVDAKALLKRARAEGISERTLRRAKKRVGVESQKSGFGETGAWTWRLRVPPPDVPLLRHPLAVLDDDLAALEDSDPSKAAKAAIDGHEKETWPGGIL